MLKHLMSVDTKRIVFALSCHVAFCRHCMRFSLLKSCSALVSADFNYSSPRCRKQSLKRTDFEANHHLLVGIEKGTKTVIIETSKCVIIIFT